MLLVCERHTADDLALWASLERADLENYDVLDLQKKAKKAIETIGRFVSEGDCYVSTSWGKDSCVLSHLAWRCGGLRVGNVAQPGVFQDPYVNDVRDYFLSRWPIDYHELSVPLNAVKEWKRSSSLSRGIELLQAKFGTNRYIGGVRAAESGARKISLRARSTKGTSTCQPIGWWTDADVFSYMAYWQLPVHPSYGMTGGGRWDRGKIRVSIIGGPKGRNYGRGEWEMEYYSDLINKQNLEMRK